MCRRDELRKAARIRLKVVNGRRPTRVGGGPALCDSAEDLDRNEAGGVDDGDESGLDGLGGCVGPAPRRFDSRTR